MSSVPPVLFSYSFKESPTSGISTHKECIVDYSQKINKDILEYLIDQEIILYSYLCHMGLTKIKFQTNLENINNDALVRICIAIREITDAKWRKNLAAKILSEADPNLISKKSDAKNLVVQSNKEYENAVNALKTTSTATKINVLQE